MSSLAKKTVFVAMSGGVDSSVAALLLKQQGYDVVGVFMKNFSARSLGLSDDAAQQWEESCPWERDSEDVRAVCDSLDIPYYTLNFEKEYKQKVLDYFFSEYAHGRTPNPDIMCNREIKFKVFLDQAVALGADFIATGHYARTFQSGNRFRVFIPRDRYKDQTYFLYTLSQKELPRIVWPLSHLTKTKVRAIAKKAGLPNAAKPDSQGICFVGEVNMRDFLSVKIRAVPGPIVTIDGTVIGRHQGLVFYTLGQRQGIGVGGCKKPLYVVKKDERLNQLVVVEGVDHPALFHRRFIVEQPHWISSSPHSFPLRSQVRIRHRQPLQEAVVDRIESGQLEVVCSVPQRAVAPGQSAVFYKNREVLGGGVIERLVDE